MWSRGESLLSVHPAWSYRYRWGTARASTAAWGLLCRRGIAGAVYSVGESYRVGRCRWGVAENMFSVGEPYRVSYGTTRRLLPVIVSYFGPIPVKI